MALDFLIVRRVHLYYSFANTILVSQQYLHKYLKTVFIISTFFKIFSQTMLFTAKKSYLYDEFIFTSAQAHKRTSALMLIIFSFLPIISKAQISGTVTNGIQSLGMNGVSVVLSTAGGSLITNTTTSVTNTPLLTAGGFSSIGASGSCRANITKTASWTDGVSTLDIVLINRHILAVQPLSSGFKWIAGDINQNGYVSTADILILRDLILANISSLPKWSKPWQFVPGSVVNAPNNNFFPLGTPPAINSAGFPSMENVFGPKLGGGTEIYPTWLSPIYDIVLSTNSANNQNGFYGVKIGDVNGSASFFTGNATTRESVAFNTENASLEAGKAYTFQISNKELAQNYLGFQFGVKFDSDAITIEGVSSPNLPEFDKECYNQSNIEGVLRVLWLANSGKPQLIDENSFVTVKVKVKKNDVRLNEVFQLDQEVLPLEFVTSNTTEVYPSLDLKVEEDKSKEHVENAILFPNPVQDLLTIGINNSKGAEISIIDILGRQVLTTQVNAGTTSTVLDVSSLVSGAFICEIKTFDTVSKKVFIKR